MQHDASAIDETTNSKSEDGKDRDEEAKGCQQHSWARQGMNQQHRS
jgi:hypothetical protein